MNYVATCISLTCELRGYMYPYMNQNISKGVHIESLMYYVGTCISLTLCATCLHVSVLLCNYVFICISRTCALQCVHGSALQMYYVGVNVCLMYYVGPYQPDIM